MAIDLKTRRFLLLGSSTTCALIATIILTFSLGTNHWRVRKDAKDGSTISQGLLKECFRNKTTAYCKRIAADEGGRFKLQEELYVLTYCFLVSAVISMIASIVLSLAASCTQRSFHFILVLALESVAGILVLAGISLYAHKYAKDDWSLSWSYILTCVSLVLILFSFVLHLIAKDVKFFGKKMLTPTVYWGPNIDPL